MQSISVCSKRN